MDTQYLTAKAFIEDLVLQPPIPLPVAPSSRYTQLLPALREYRMSVLRAFGQFEREQERIWHEMAQQRHTLGRAGMLPIRTSGKDMALTAAEQIAAGVKSAAEGGGYSSRNLHSVAERVLEAINTAKKALQSRPRSASSRSSVVSATAPSASPTLAAFRASVELAPFEKHSAPPEEVGEAYDAFRAAALRAITPSIWAKMERLTFREKTYAQLAQAWVTQAHKALLNSVHGGRIDVLEIQIEAAEKEVMEELVGGARRALGLPPVVKSSLPLAERREW